ncbi:PREDICTED: protein trunk-like [Priapulus caudatus]|uniref:Protein trunk-like n=1 Tax=Priapulus caudatus TaxID=37621 RepID=A0ABM1DNH0_PRICU|nr:PREDICTED: protein trunk-like [Priapulus caudatus]
MPCPDADVVLMLAAVLLVSVTVARPANKTIGADDDDVVVDKIECPPTPPDFLRTLLGPAFNERYMSVDEPADEWSADEWSADVGRRRDGKDGVLQDASHTTSAKPTHGPFVVGGDYERDLPTEKFYVDMFRSVLARMRDDARTPTTVATPVPDELEAVSDVGGNSTRGERTKRAAGATGGTPWGCDSRVVWHDLGPDRFPRFLRGVECTSSKCWFGHFSCRPKAFTVKVLRRKRDACSQAEVNGWRAPPGGDIFPTELLEKTWTFEERSVTFCCECVL